MLFLHKFEERRHIWPSEMVDSLQPREHAPALKPLEVIFANVLKIMNEVADTFFEQYNCLPALSFSSRICGKIAL